MGTAAGSKNITVPDGYVLVPKLLRFFPSRVLTVVDSTGVQTLEFLLDFFINGSGVPQNTNISIRLTEDEQDFPLYFLAPVAGVLSIQLRADVTAFGDVPINVAFTMSANLILSDGGPTNLQVGGRHREATTRGGNVIFDNKGVS